jgi:hypoxanthine phosphoribosyltransferase
MSTEIQEYGKTQYELDAEKSLECRKIVKNIVNFGVSEAQKVQLIYLLGLELDSRESLELIAGIVKKIRESDKKTNFILNNNDPEYTQINEEKKILDL